MTTKELECISCWSNYRSNLEVFIEIMKWVDPVDVKQFWINSRIISWKRVNYAQENQHSCRLMMMPHVTQFITSDAKDDQSKVNICKSFKVITIQATSNILVNYCYSCPKFSFLQCITYCLILSYFNIKLSLTESD